MSANPLSQLNSESSSMEKLPVLFVGHGSPMNAIESNEYVKGFIKVGTELPKPIAILCISAHWYIKGTHVTAMAHPKTIHDFGGFPEALYKEQYPAPGSPELAKSIHEDNYVPKIELDHSWGLDHGAWTVLKHLFPKADVPVLQLSIDYTKPAEWHFEFARQLKNLREKGVLIIGSGNIIHNLYQVAFDRINENFGYDWAIEAHDKINKLILDNDFKPLTQYEKLGKAVQNAAPTPDHFLPLLYALALKDDKDSLSLFNDKLLAGSLSMTSVKIG